MSHKTSSKKKDDAPYDLEQQFILRLPPGPAMALRHDVESGAMSLKDKVAIELKGDMRHGSVRYGGEMFSAKLKDLPCIIEAYKTTDLKNVYKTADICQMLVCKTDDESSEDEAGSPQKKKDKEKKHQMNHGITPPLKNVRKRRFRKTLKKKYQEQPEIEKEVKQLFRMDNEAVDVKWEVIIDEDKSTPGGGKDQQVLVQGETSAEDLSLLMQETLNPLELAKQDIFGDISSSDEEKDVDIMDSGEEDNSLSRLDAQDSIDYATGDMGDTDADLQGKLQELKEQLEEIRDRKTAQENDMATTQDPALRERLEAVLENIVGQENEKQQEYEILASMLNQS